jgi:hypothetical protein
MQNFYLQPGKRTGLRGSACSFLRTGLGTFASRLPRALDHTDIAVVYPHGVTQDQIDAACGANAPGDLGRYFKVSSSRVRAALSWLKSNNQYYKDVEIDEEVLRDLPSNGSVVQVRSGRGERGGRGCASACKH